MTTSPREERAPRFSLSHEERAARTADLLIGAAEAAARGDDAERARCLEGVVELNMRIAEALARRYSNRGIPLEDLTQVAYLALVRVARSFDPAHGRDFLSYAVPSMTGEIRRHFRDHGWTIRPPRGVQRAHSRLLRSERDFDRLDERSVSELAAQVEESVETVREALAARSCFSLTSLDAPVGDSEAPRDVPAGDRAAEQTEARLVVEPLLAQLSTRERDVVRLRFADELSQREIAEQLGMTQIQVSRLLRRVLSQFAGALHAPHPVAS
ncbi:sigma-70 family RNA polymerase sigma factor [Nocardioides acrostichi]|uniref:Sigma-70 family RNA polymerase sigma factor n=1 Tax=Nocardioides acrostichi TaxID=2784339 RepID=A0A930UV23_9ACTN|nr:sigma-70 family RNA polymerase sigma factor [Nocardioides acrostichi]MBF4161383.1 sigma-70 family RNA polymerase sigma factor [Nocardioides acrostichi]